MRASHDLDGITVTADDTSLVADAGLLLPATLGQRLGLPQLLDQRVTAGAHAADKCLTVIHSALAGGDCIDDVDALRAGATQAVLGHRVAAPSTVGTFLRSMTFGQAGQLDAVSRALLGRAVQIGAITAPVGGPFVVDIDATLIETYGLAKQGARDVMRTDRRGYHPILAVAAGTGDVLHARLRRGRSNDATGAPAFVTETLSRVRQAGIHGPVVLPADTGFYLADVLAACRKAGVGFSIGARMIGRMRALIEGLDESAWTPVPYFEPGAAVAELSWLAFDQDRRGPRLVQAAQRHSRTPRRRSTAAGRRSGIRDPPTRGRSGLSRRRRRVPHRPARHLHRHRAPGARAPTHLVAVGRHLLRRAALWDGLESPDHLVQRADDALNRARAEGRTDPSSPDHPQGRSREGSSRQPLTQHGRGRGPS